MNEDQYRRLCDACDQILTVRGATPERLATAWLHVLREHPALLVAYRDLFSSTDFASRLQWLGPLTAINYLLKIVRQLVWALYCSIAEAIQAPKKKQKIEILIVSHILDKDEGSSSDDLYFGPIAHSLSARGLRVAVLSISHARKRPLFTTEPKTKSGVRRYVLGKTMPLRSELRFLSGLLRESQSLKASSREYNGLNRLVRIAAAAEEFSPATLNALRIASQVAEMVVEFSPDCLLTTFEGHAWERVAFMKAHAALPHIKCFGYQHSATFRLQHSINRPLGNMADPDLVLSAGAVGAHQLSRSWGRAKSLMLGSPKAKVSGRGGEKQPRTGNRCLVLPEGIMSEAILLAEFCFECAEAIPDLVFVLRFHPVFNYQALLKLAPQFSRLPSNVEISVGRSLASDSSSATWAIYRGSTAIIEAIEHGVVPVYLSRNLEMTIDPLFALEDGRQIIKTTDDLIQIINSWTYNSYGSQRAIAYCKELLSPLNIEILVDALGRKMERAGP
jgi:hypothetical protein